MSNSDQPEDVSAFAKRIREKTSAYAEVPDGELVRKVVAKYPEYRSSVKLPDSSVDYRGLSDFAKGQGFTVTSTTGGTHNPGSLHPLGKAIDVRIRDKRPEELDAFRQAAEAQGIRVVDESRRPAGRLWSAPHYHLEATPDTSIASDPFTGMTSGAQGEVQSQPAPTAALPVKSPRPKLPRPARDPFAGMTGGVAGEAEKPSTFNLLGRFNEQAAVPLRRQLSEQAEATRARPTLPPRKYPTPRPQLPPDLVAAQNRAAQEAQATIDDKIYAESHADEFDSRVPTGVIGESSPELDARLQAMQRQSRLRDVEQARRAELTDKDLADLREGQQEYKGSALKRAVMSPVEGYAADKMHMIGNALSRLGGDTPVGEVGDYLRRRAQVSAGAAEYRPEETKGALSELPVEVSRYILRSGLDIGTLVGFQRGTGASLPSIMVGESVLRNLDKDPETQRREAVKAAAMGKAMEKLSLLNRFASGAVFGGQELAQGVYEGDDRNKLIARTLGGAVTGAALGNSEGARLRDVPRMAAQGVGLARPETDLPVSNATQAARLSRPPLISGTADTLAAERRVETQNAIPQRVRPRLSQPPETGYAQMPTVPARTLDAPRLVKGTGEAVRPMPEAAPVPETPAEVTQTPVAATSQTIIRHSNPEIDGDAVVGRTFDGKLKVQGEDGKVHIVQDPRRQGNREAALVKEAARTPVPALADEQLRAIKNYNGSDTDTTAEAIASSPFKREILQVIGAAEPPAQAEFGQPLEFRRADGTKVLVRIGSKAEMDAGEAYYGRARTKNDPGVLVRVVKDPRRQGDGVDATPDGGAVQAVEADSGTAKIGAANAREGAADVPDGVGRPTHDAGVVGVDAGTQSQTENLSRNFRAGTNDATLTFASPEQRDLYDLAAKSRYQTRGGQNKTGQRAVGDVQGLRSSLRTRLNLSNAEISDLASRTYEDVRSQMKGVKHLEERAIADNVSRPETVSTAAVPDAQVFRERIKSSFNLKEPQAEAVTQLVDARARAWAKEAPDRTPEGYYAARFAGIERGGEVGGSALNQDAPTVTQAPEFKRWFGRSKVVDEKGEPLAVYHNSPAKGVEIFMPFARDLLNGDKSPRDVERIIEKWRKADRISTSDFRAGTFFTPSPTEYNSYGEHQYKVYLRAENPITYDTVSRKATISDKSKPADAYIIAHDGQIDEIAVLYPEQIKSATGNRGTFDPSDPNILRQQKKASVEFLSDGRAILRGLQKPDVSSAVHEFAHVFRRDLEPDLLSAAEESLGVKDGKWEVSHEEKFARGFERYLKTGEAPSTKLRQVFESFKSWLTEIYGAVRGKDHPLGFKPNPELVAVFDRALGGAPKGGHGRNVSLLYKSPDGATPAFFAHDAVRAKLGLEPIPADANPAERSRMMTETAGALTEATGRTRSSQLHPEMLERWARQNNLPDEAVKALQVARENARPKLATSEAAPDPEQDFKASLPEKERAKLQPFDAMLADKRVSSIIDALYDPKGTTHAQAEEQLRRAARAFKVNREHVESIIADAANERTISEGESVQGVDTSEAAGRGRIVEPSGRPAGDVAKRPPIGKRDPNRAPEFIEPALARAANRIIADEGATWQDALRRAAREQGKPLNPDILFQTAPQVLAARQRAYRALQRAQQLAPQRTPPLEVLTALRRAGLLTGVKTHLRNIVSNTAFQLSEEAAKPFQVLADLAIARKTGERTVAAPSIASVARSAKDATVKGIPEAWDVLLGRQQVQSQQQLNKVRSGLPVLDAYINTVFNAMEAGDRVFKTYAVRRSLEEQAKAQAMTEKRANPSLDARTRARQLASNPTADMQAEAVAYAEYATFQNDNLASEVVKLLKTGDPAKLFPNSPRLAAQARTVQTAGRFVFEQLVPFDKTPTNIIARILEYSPVGLAQSGFKYRRGRQSAQQIANSFMSAADQKAFAQTFGRGSLGSGVLALGTLLAAKGLLAGNTDYEEDKDRYFQRRREGVQNGSLAVPGTGQRIVVSGHPLGNILTLGATMYEQATRRAKTVDEQVSRTAKAGLATIKEYPILRAFDDYFGSSRTIGERAGAFLGSYVPTIVSDAGEVADPKTRQAKGFTAQIAKRVPVVRESLPESPAPLGGADEKGGVGRRLLRAVDPLQATTNKDTGGGGGRRPRLSLPARTNVSRRPRLAR